MSHDQNRVPRSAMRQRLCSADHAQRVAAQMFDEQRADISIIRTGNPLQPLRVMASNLVGDRSREIAIVTA